ncbi:MAG: HORMA-1 domain-containing protein [Candidatus Acidiferrales bacterium]
MSYSETLTQTYTIADIGKVIDCFAADLDMTSQSTGLLNRDLVKKYAADVKAMAQQGYLLEANIVLKDAAGNVIRAAKYEVNTGAASLTASRPGNNRWPATPGGELSIVLQNSKKWRDLTDSQKSAFNKTLNTSWVASSTDLSFPALTRTADRNYVSNGWGVMKSVYQ